MGIYRASLHFTCFLSLYSEDNIRMFPPAWVLRGEAGADELSAAPYGTHTQKNQRDYELQLLTAARPQQQLASKELILQCVVKRLDNGLFIWGGGV